MSQAVALGINFFICGLEIYMLDIFLSAIFEKRVSRRKYIIYFIGVVCTICGINMLANPMLNFLAVPALFFTFSMLIFQISAHKSFVYSVLYYIVFACGREMAFEMLFRFFEETLPWVRLILSFFNGMPFYAMEYILSFLFLLYLGKYMKKIEIREDGNFDWYLLVMPISSIMILFSFVYMDFPKEKYLQILMCCGSFLLYFSNAVIFIILAHFTQVMNQVKTAELYVLKRDMEQDNFENVTKMNEVCRKYMHEMHKYFYEFKSLAVEGETTTIVNIINDLEGSLEREASSKLYTDNAVVNTLLSRCYDSARERQTEIDIFVEDRLNLDFIQDVDKISMFGNLLDNAVEAAAQCAEGNRKIHIKIFMGNKHFLIFRIENTWVKKLRTEGGKLLSTKKDSRNHGLGIGISRELAQKYGGSLELEEQGEWFIVTLMIAH